MVDLIREFPWKILVLKTFSFGMLTDLWQSFYFALQRRRGVSQILWRTKTERIWRKNWLKLTVILLSDKLNLVWCPQTRFLTFHHTTNLSKTFLPEIKKYPKRKLYFHNTFLPNHNFIDNIKKEKSSDLENRFGKYLLSYVSYKYDFSWKQENMLMVFGKISLLKILSKYWYLFMLIYW